MLDPLDDPASLDRDPDRGGLIIPAETLRALAGQPRHLPGRRVAWSGSDPFNATATDAGRYVAGLLAQLDHTNGM